MKTKLFYAALFLLVTNAFSQQGINYKALIKDGGGNIVANQTIDVRFTIIADDGPTNVYLETHTGATTDANGIVILNIGDGTSADVFTDIAWGSDIHSLKVEIDIEQDTSFEDMGTTQFMAVPYALNAATKIDELSDGKSDNDGTEDGSSVYLGIDAGLNDDGTDNKNVAVGFEALKSNTTGSSNTANGYEALYSNKTGTKNTATGYQALYSSNVSGANTATGYQALYSNTEGIWNTATGTTALFNNSTGNSNTGVGEWALRNNDTGSKNTGLGDTALLYNSTGNENTAIGYGSLLNNNASGNTAVGYQSLNKNTTGDKSTAFGYQALYSNTTGHRNAATGQWALYSNLTGHRNTALGLTALYSNIGGYKNVATGYQALYYNTEGVENTATGTDALLYNINGDANTANGFQALYNNITANYNTATGYQALYSNIGGVFNTAIGLQALHSNLSGSGNTAIGYYALGDLTTGVNNLGIGGGAQVPSSAGNHQIRMGNTLISHADIQVAWNVTSDRRWKENIRVLPYGLEVLKQLKPVDYTRKNNEHNTREMGFIAQDVEALLAKIGYKDQGFLHKDDKGFMSLRYNDFIALLTKAIQEQQEIIESLKGELKAEKSENIQQNGNYAKLLKRVEQLELVSNQ